MEMIHEEIVRAAEAVPPLPQSVIRLCSLFADPEYEVRDVVRAVDLDPSLSLKLLRLANSAAHGGTIRTTGEAVVRLGAGTVQSLAISEVARPRQNADLSPFGLTADSYWRHCIATVAFAEAISAQRRMRLSSGLTVAAITHDFGKLILADQLSNQQSRAAKLPAGALASFSVQDELLGINHAKVTAIVAEAWGLAADLVRAVRYHHTPEVGGDPLCHALNVANQLAWQLEDRTMDSLQTATRESSLAAIQSDSSDWETLFRAGECRYHATLEFYS